MVKNLARYPMGRLRTLETGKNRGEAGERSETDECQFIDVPYVCEVPIMRN